ncbi:ABC transporter substrate-binding protein [Paenisporosarcina indica]|uniref:ABC transporter substrate-binding protein n=1 Tax=Paenisporosarcina indica TaxID=650093 RepID=UPI00094F52B7|nr:ABC transporter substrate-binding protein [Paenisporosarcina indica]
MKRTVQKVLCLMTILSLLILTACSGEATEKDNTGNEKKQDSKSMFIGLVNPPTGFNPINAGDVAAMFIQKYFQDTLLEMDGPLNFVPRLAESFESEDGQHYTVKINKDAKWTDGTPVTSEDLAFTINTIANPKSETSQGANISMLAGLEANGKLPEGQTELSSVKIIDDKTVELTTAVPVDPNYMKEIFGLNVLTLPKHILGDVPVEELSKHSYMQNPTVSSGAFKFVKYEKDQFVELAANKDYYLGTPELEKLFIKIMPAPNLVGQLQTGELDFNVSKGIGKIAVQDYETVEGLKNVVTNVEPTIGFQTMYFNNTKFNNEVRTALSMAIDRQLIVDKLLKGFGEVIDGPYSSVSPFLDKSVGAIEYNPEKAKEMLEKAGFDFNTPLEFVVPIGNKVREQSAPIIAQSLEAIGVKTKITNYDFPTIMAKGKEGAFDLLLLGFTLTLDPDVSSIYATGATYNFMGYSDPEMDALLVKGKQEPDTEKRKVIYSEIQKKIIEEAPIVTLYSDHDFSGVNKRVEFGKPVTFGMHHNLQKWSVSGAN